MQQSKIKYIFIIFLLCTFAAANAKTKIGVVSDYVVASNKKNAQIYPVRTHVHTIPPYPVHLPDYGKPESNNMQVQLVLNDASATMLEVTLKMQLTNLTTNGSVVTKQTAIIRPFSFKGMPAITLQGADLAPYFRQENMEFFGISRYEYIRSGGKLPEGQYRVSWTAYETRHGLQVSNTATAILCLMQHERPFWVSPQDGITMEATNTPSILFRWQQPSGGCNPLTGVQYELSMVELWPNENMNPNLAFEVLPAFYKETVNQTQFLLTNYPPLSPGRKYAVRVQAKTTGNATIKNDGYSQPLTFTFGKASVIPKGLLIN